MNVGERIAAWRKYRQMSQRALAKAVGLTPGAIGQWESGGSDDEPTSPSYKNLEKVLEALKLSWTQFHGPVPKRKAKAA